MRELERVRAMQITTSQDAFHTMRGHVADGTMVKMENGNTLKIKNEIKGWVILKHNAVIAGPFSSAIEVEIFIVNYGV